jgi:hypothetical protein
MAMPIHKIIEHCAITQKTTSRNATDEEIAQIELDAQNEILREAKAKAEVAERTALLERLGITSDEAKLLLS